MDKLFTFEIGTQYTWTGKSTKGVDKNKFGDLKNIFAAISGKIRFLLKTKVFITTLSLIGAVLANNDITADEKTAIKIQFQVSE